MRKNTMFISAALTAFVLAILAGVVSAYTGISNSKPSSQSSANLQPMALSVAVTPMPTQPSNVTAQDAAAIASKYLNHTDLYSVELADLQGTQTYKVTFSSGDIVYVGMDGQVLSTTPPPAPVVVYTNSGSGGRGRGQGSGSAPAPSSGESGGEHSDGGGD